MCSFRKPKLLGEQLGYLQSLNAIMPQVDDFMDAADGVIRMQGTYQLLASDIANGLLDGMKYNSSLVAIDCQELGRDLINQHYLATAEKWILAGIEAYDRTNPQLEMQLQGVQIGRIFFGYWDK
ncbi:prolyl 4-hydroxylase subunit alpha-2-like isoform X2 [Drosophila takahashii]|uniref:prolyl 4-hydroxylase subunit alpha-2-like isoform X2 n=1 Tax=Drosophila takahashii TaxID=29030 RepID=UPI0038993E11